MINNADPQVKTELTRRSKIKINELKSRDTSDIESVKDTRGTHTFMFHGLTVDGFEVCVGEYRRIDGDPKLNVPVCFGGKVGAKPSDVPDDMDKLRAFIEREASLVQNTTGIDRRVFFAQCLVFIATVVRNFILIHPYRDGNGRMSRFLVLAVLVPLGYFPYDWVIHPRPFPTRYGSAMINAGNGNLCELVALIASDFKDVRRI